MCLHGLAVAAMLGVKSPLAERAVISCGIVMCVASQLTGHGV